ncbi:tetratricopeptide repeat protein [Pseudomonadota bacterium]
MFWTIAAAVLFAAALISLSPLLRARSLWQALALALVFLLPAGAVLLYKQVGTPAAIGMSAPARQAAAATPHANEAHSPDSAEMDTMIAGLRSKLADNPNDLDGWMLLARTLRATQHFPEAMEALETASRLSPGNPYITVDIVETQIYMSPGGKITQEMTATLQQALEVQPDMEKALWLLGIAASQAGDNEVAITYWETLLAQIEPDSNVAKSIQSQINAAKGRMGMPVEQTAAVETDVSETPSAPATQPAAGATWPGVHLTVKADPAAQSEIPEGGVLFVVIRSPGPAVGPPIGVRRIMSPTLPLEIDISDQDSMIKERKISAEKEVQFQAKYSLTGSPTTNPGDWLSKPVTVKLDGAETVELVIDQHVE